MSSPPHPARRRTLAVALALLLVLGAGGLLFPQQLLDRLGRPLLEAVLSRQLATAISIDTLRISHGILHLEGIMVADPGRTRLEIGRLECPLTWSIVSEQRLERLVLDRPLLHLAESSPGRSIDSAWPSSPPLTVDSLVIQSGSIRLPGPDRRTLRLSARGSLGRSWALEMKLHLGDANDPKRSFAIAARGTWDAGLRAEIERLSWQGRSLLQAPAHLTLDQATPIALDADLTWPSLDQQDLVLLFELGGHHPPDLPAWQLDQPRLTVEMAAGRLQLTASAADLTLGGHPAEPQLRSLQLTAAGGPASALEVVAGGQLGPARDPLEVFARLERGREPVMKISRIAWRGQQLLAEPLQVSLAEPLVSGNASLKLDRLDAATLRPLLETFRLHLPAEPGWTVSELTFEPVWDAGRLQLTLAAAGGRLLAAGRGLRFGRLQANVVWSEPEWSLTVEAELEGASHLQGHLQRTGAQLSGQALLTLPKLQRFTAEQPGLGLPPLTGAATLRGNLAGAPAAPRLELEVGVDQLTLPEKPQLPGLSLTGSARLEPAKTSWRLSDGSLRATLAAPWGGKLHGRFAGGPVATGWALRFAELVAADLAWSAADGLSAFAGGGIMLKGSVTATRSAGVHVDLAGDLQGGELLYGTTYLPLQEAAAQLQLRGTLTEDGYRLWNGQVTIPQLGTLALHAEDNGQERFHADLELPDLAQAFGRYGPVLFSDHPSAGRSLAFAGGLRLSAEGLRQEHNDWRLQLEIEPRQLEISYGEDFAVSGLQGKLPLLFGAGEPDASATGILAWKSLELGPARAEDAELKVEAHPGRLRLPGRLDFGLAAGRLELSELVLAHPPGHWEAAANVKISDLQLQPLTRELGWPALQGGLSADLGRLGYRGGALTIAGTAQLDVFGGQILITGMRMAELRSRYPVFYADIDFNGIDLYRLTSTFAFGEMNGVIDGHIRQLRLFGATPTRFDAALHSRDQGTRNISVKALNNLTILSQGGLSAALSRGIYQFIDFYRYRSIGIDCSLANDLLHLRGTAREDSDRYLVYGGWLPPRIDILVSSATVPFTEMVKRLQRIDRSPSTSP